MPSGDTFVATVENGLDTMIASARTTREYPNDVMVSLADRQTLQEHTGTAWVESLTAQLTASNYGETDTIDNPQQYVVSLINATPQLTSVQTFIGRRVEARLNAKVFATFGEQGMLAMGRKKDQDGLALFASAGTTLCGTGTTLTNGHVAAGGTRIKTPSTDPGMGKIVFVDHGYAFYDLFLEHVAGLGTYPIPAGMTEDVFRSGFRGTIDGVMTYEDGLVAVNSTPDCRGGVFLSGKGGATILVQGMSPWTEKRDEPQKGYGGMTVWLKDDYIWKERLTSWLFGILSDATAPTS